MMRTHACERHSAVHKRRGTAAIFVLMCMVTLLGFAALTVDVGYVYNVRAELQNAADAMALAGTSALSLGPAAVRDRVQEFAAKQSGLAQLDVQDGDIVLGLWQKDAAEFIALSGDDEDNATAVRVIASMTQDRGNALNLFFAGILGNTSMNVSAAATATFGSTQGWNVVIVQDVTGSFEDEIDESRIADQGLLDCIKENTGSHTQVGLVVFTGYGFVLSGMQTMETGYASLSASIATIDRCGDGVMPPCSGTNIGAGLDKAIPLLAGLDSDLPPAIILVSDGQPQSSLPGYSDDDLKQWAIDSADAAAAQGISIFTLFYSGNDGSSGASDFLASLVRGSGTAHETPNPANIAAELEDICKEGVATVLQLVE